MIAEENRVEATPGPWEVCEFSADHPDALPGEVGVYAPQHPDSYIKEDGTWHGITICRGMTGPAKYANAQLIASVPDLRATIDAQAQEIVTLRAELAAGGCRCDCPACKYCYGNDKPQEGAQP